MNLVESTLKWMLGFLYKTSKGSAKKGLLYTKGGADPTFAAAKVKNAIGRIGIFSIIFTMVSNYLSYVLTYSSFPYRSLCHRPRPRGILILPNGLESNFWILLLRPSDKLDMTRGWGQWPWVTWRTGWNQCALLLWEECTHWNCFTCICSFQKFLHWLGLSVSSRVWTACTQLLRFVFCVTWLIIS